jgi:hypothetical protein
MTVHYLELVSNDVDTLTALYQRVHGLSFGPQTPTSGRPVSRLERTELWLASASRWQRMSSRPCEPTSQ